MISSQFEKWLIKNENKASQTAYIYSKAINRISKHYSVQTNQAIDLYAIAEISKLKIIAELYGTSGKYSEFGQSGNGTNRAAINSYCRFREHTKDFNFTLESPVEEEIEIDSDAENTSTNFSYERDLKNSVVFGNENEGVEYLIGGKRIDILLEKSDNSLLAIELKSGIADYKVFGQISMYLGLLMERYPEREISGCIIAGEIDDNLKRATSITNKVTLMSYTMKLELNMEK
jgi:hypothetical protein